jgi:hypothetical protein
MWNLDIAVEEPAERRSTPSSGVATNPSSDIDMSAMTAPMTQRFQVGHGPKP